MANELGLNVCMIDADRLRIIAARSDERPAAQLLDIAQRLEQEVRDVLELRDRLRQHGLTTTGEKDEAQTKEVASAAAETSETIVEQITAADSGTT